MLYFRKDEDKTWTLLGVTRWLTLSVSTNNRMKFNPYAAPIAVDFTLIGQTGMHCFDGIYLYEYLDFEELGIKNDYWDLELWFLGLRVWVIGTNVRKHKLLKGVLKDANRLV